MQSAFPASLVLPAFQEFIKATADQRRPESIHVPRSLTIIPEISSQTRSAGVAVLSRQIYSNYTAILPYTYRRESLRVEDGGRREERSEVLYCIVRDTYLYIIDVRTDHAVFMCGAVWHTSVYLLMGC